MSAFAAAQHVIDLPGRRASGGKCVSKPTRIVCRAGKGTTKNDKARKGRGRAAKRTALYDAMAEYANFFHPLLDAELAAEQAGILAARDSSRPRSAQVESGTALFQMRVMKGERIFSNAVFQLRFDDGRRIPESNRFNSGDLLTIRAQDTALTLDENENGDLEVTVIFRKTHRLDIAVPVASQAFYTLRMFADTAETVNAFQGASAISHERAVTALEVVTTPSSTTNSLVKLITKSLAARIVAPSESVTPENGTCHSSRSSASAGFVPGLMNAVSKKGTLTEWEELAGETVRSHYGKSWTPAVSLNASQIRAVRAALSRSISLIHGPPGTGKTLVLAHLVFAALAEGRGPVLVTAASNVAADELLSKLVHLGTKSTNIVRVGAVAAVNPDLWPHTLDAQLERDSTLRAARERLMKSARPDSALQKAEIEASRRIIGNGDVVVATCIGSGRELLKDARFPFLVIDEATQATEPDVLVPLAIGGGEATRQLVLAGDHHQLPPTVLSTRSGNGEDDGLRRSLFMRLWQANVASVLLDMQYRMHPAIAMFPSEHFYAGKVRNAISETDRRLPDGLEGTVFDTAGSRVIFVDVAHGEETRGSVQDVDGPKQGFSYSNRIEADVVVNVLRLLTGEGRKEGIAIDQFFGIQNVGVISPYAGQARLLRQLTGNRKDLRSIEIATVDGFQGREKEAIVVSAVRCNNNGEVGFLADWRRLNVAITRARTLLVVIGSARTLRNDPNWNAWLRWVRRSKCRIDVGAIEEAIEQSN